MTTEIKDTIEKQFFIFIGRSGCGKGTQAELLKTYLENKNQSTNESTKVLHITTGGGFRDFVNNGTLSASLAKNINDAGGLQPEFLAIWNWSNIFINTLTGNETVMLDGAPRRLIEVTALHSAIDFYNYKNVTVIYLDVTEGWAIEKLVARGREDDSTSDEIQKKMDWFKADILPVVDWYKNDPEYKFLHINGERSIDDIHADILSRL
jgi:adenylate kinase family enzyme